MNQRPGSPLCCGKDLQMDRVLALYGGLSESQNQISPAPSWRRKATPRAQLTCRSEEGQSFSKVCGEILLAASRCSCMDQGDQKRLLMVLLLLMNRHNPLGTLQILSVQSSCVVGKRYIPIQGLHSNYHYRNAFLCANMYLYIYIYVYIRVCSV